MTATLAPEAPTITDAEADALITLAASSDKIARVPTPANTPRFQRTTGTSRAWSLGGMID